MIKADQLKPTDNPGYRLRGESAEVISLPMLQELLLQHNDEHFGLPIAIEKDQIKYGGFLNSKVEDCLILTNREHINDYFKYCITLKRQGKIATIDMRYYGISKLTGAMWVAEERGKSIGGKILNVIKGVDQSAVEAEYEYYSMIENLFAEVLC